MLYDPKWEKAIDTKPSLRGFIAWLETKDPKGKYDFNNCQGACLMGQYMTFIDMPWGETPNNAHTCNWKDTNYIRTASQVFGNRNLDELQTKPWTYGAALKRCRATFEGTGI